MTTNGWKWKNQVFKKVDFDLQLLTVKHEIYGCPNV